MRCSTWDWARSRSEPVDGRTSVVDVGDELTGGNLAAGHELRVPRRPRVGVREVLDPNGIAAVAVRHVGHIERDAGDVPPVGAGRGQDLADVMEQVGVLTLRR